MNYSDAVGLRVRTRLVQIADRLSELHVHSEEMSGAPPAGLRDQLTRALGHADQARARAVEAAGFATVAYLRAAKAHDRLADLYERQAAGVAGDAAAYRQQADRQRMLAAEDRAAASRGASQP